jgi:hypothetical protein
MNLFSFINHKRISELFLTKYCHILKNPLSFLYVVSFLSFLNRARSFFNTCFMMSSSLFSPRLSLLPLESVSWMTILFEAMATRIICPTKSLMAVLTLASGHSNKMCATCLRLGQIELRKIGMAFSWQIDTILFKLSENLQMDFVRRNYLVVFCLSENIHEEEEVGIETGCQHSLDLWVVDLTVDLGGESIGVELS